MTSTSRATFALLLSLSVVTTGTAAAEEKPREVRDIGSRLELFVDRFLIDRLDGTELRMHHPTPAPPSQSPRPPGHYATVIKDGPLYRFYSRGYKIPDLHWRKDGWDTYHLNEVTLYAESKNGVHWTTPDLDLYKIERYPNGNVVLADELLVNHNFTPFIDTRPGVPPEERYKAVGGLRFPANHQHLREKHGAGGLKAFASPDRNRSSRRDGGRSTRRTSPSGRSSTSPTSATSAPSSRATAPSAEAPPRTSSTGPSRWP